MKDFETTFLERTGFEFNNFYIKYSYKLKFHLGKLTNDKHLIDDCIEDAFLKTIQNLHMYKTENEGGSKFITWFYIIAENTLKAEYKKYKRIPINNYEFLDLLNIEYKDDFQEKLEEEQITKVKEEYAKKCIGEIKNDNQRIALTLKDISGMTLKDMSIELNLNINTIKSQLKMGRRKVARKLKIKYKL